MSGKTEFPTPVESLTIEWSQQQSWTSSPSHVFWSVNLCANFLQPFKPRGTGGMVVWPSELHGLHAIGSGPLWQPVAHCNHIMQARVVLELRVGEQQWLFSLLVWQQWLPCVVFPVGDILRQVLVPALRQQEDANDADERAAGEDDVVQEVAFLVVQLNNGRCQHAETCTGQHQPEPTTPAGGESTGLNGA